MQKGIRAMSFDPVIEAAKVYIEELFASNAGGHDAAHTLRVYRNAMLLADYLPDCDRGIAALAVLLHDADDRKLFDTKDNANARTFAYGGEHGRSLEESVAHFHEKLLLLKDEMTTEAAKRLAERRHAFMEEFLREYAEETQGESK